MLMSAELEGCVTWFMYFLDLLYLRYKCDKFNNCRIIVNDCREGRIFRPPFIREQPRKDPSWTGLNCLLEKKFFSWRFAFFAERIFLLQEFSLLPSGLFFLIRLLFLLSESYSCTHVLRYKHFGYAPKTWKSNLDRKNH